MIIVIATLTLKNVLGFYTFLLLLEMYIEKDVASSVCCLLSSQP